MPYSVRHVELGFPPNPRPQDNLRRVSLTLMLISSKVRLPVSSTSSPRTSSSTNNSSLRTSSSTSNRHMVTNRPHRR